MDNNLFKQRMLGAWLLDTYVRRTADNTLVYPLSSSATGSIVYTAEGYMSAQIMRHDRAAFLDESLYGGSDREVCEAARGYFAYGGRYELDAATSTIWHHVEVSLFPNWVGQVQVRMAMLEDETLHLASKSPSLFNGIMTTSHLVWRRPKQILRAKGRTSEAGSSDVTAVRLRASAEAGTRSSQDSLHRGGFGD